MRALELFCGIGGFHYSLLNALDRLQQQKLRGEVDALLDASRLDVTALDINEVSPTHTYE